MQQHPQQQVAQIPHADQTATVPDGAERQRPARIDPAEQAQKVGPDSWTVHQGWTHDRKAKGAAGGNFGNEGLALELGGAVDILRGRAIQRPEAALSAAFAVYLDAADVHQPPYAGVRGLLGQLSGALGVGREVELRVRRRLARQVRPGGGMHDQLDPTQRRRPVRRPVDIPDHDLLSGVLRQCLIRP
jgi:hypothetical protein